MEFKERSVSPRVESLKRFEGYPSLVASAFRQGVLGYNYPFILATGNWKSLREYAEMVNDPLDRWDSELIVASIYLVESELAQERDPRHSPMLYNEVKSCIFGYQDREPSYDLQMDFAERVCDAIVRDKSIELFVPIMQEFPISDVHDVQAEFLGSHDFYYVPGSLTYDPYYDPVTGGQDVRYDVQSQAPKDGQRKLFCDLTETISQCDEITSVFYLGAYHGYGIDVVAAANPEIEFYFSDLQFPTDESYYSPNVTWIKKIEEIDHQPRETMLFYSDIFDGNNKKKSFEKQISYVRRVGARYNSIKRLLDYSSVEDVKLKRSRLWHQPWAGSSGELRERFILDALEETQRMAMDHYERHISYHEGKVRGTGAYVESKWTRCGCHDCKIFQSCLELNYISAENGDNSDLYRSKLASLSSKGMSIRFRPSIPVVMLDSDIFGDPLGEFSKDDVARDVIVPPSMVSLVGNLEGMYISPRLRINDNVVMYDSNGIFMRQYMDEVFPPGIEFVLLSKGLKTQTTYRAAIEFVEDLHDFKSTLDLSGNGVRAVVGVT